MKKKILSLVLALCILMSMLPAVIAEEGSVDVTPAEDGSSSSTGTGLLEAPGYGEQNVSISELPEEPDRGDTTVTVKPVTSDGDEGENTVTQVETTPEIADLYADRSGLTPASKAAVAQGYKAGDQVTFIVVMKQKSLFDAGYSAKDIGDQTYSVINYEEKLLNAITPVQDQAERALANDDNYVKGYTYTVASTGFSVKASYENKATLEALPGVDHVYVAPMFSLPEDSTLTALSASDLSPMSNDARDMVGAGETEYTGKGMRIAIIDTGIVVDHPSFQELPEDKLVKGKSLEEDEILNVWDQLNASERNHAHVNQAYFNTKIPYRFNYVTGGFEVDHSTGGSDHGSHVAGIAAANKVDDSAVLGVAPDAQLMVFQVFSSNGADWGDVMAAMEDAVVLGADSVNMSLGMTAGFPEDDDEMAAIIDKYAASDTLLFIAAGNDGYSAYGNDYGYNMPLIGNPDTGLLGVPAAYDGAIAVASTNKDRTTYNYFTVGETQIPFTDTSTSHKLVVQYSGQELEYVVVDGYGAPEDFTEEVKGKVALVQRGGGISFPDKQANAAAAGATALIVYNNEAGMVNMQVNDSIPCVFISKEDGETMKNATTKTFTVSSQSETLTREIPIELSVFSSWGTTPGMGLKPELSGVGGDILSCVAPWMSGAGSYYAVMSGTSMATPQVTGAAAVVKQYVEEKYPELTDSELRAVVTNILMSTATVYNTGDYEYSPRAQGSGLVNITGATAAEAYLSNPDNEEALAKAEIGDDPDRTGHYTFNFNLTNMSDEEQSYTFSSSVNTEGIYEESGSDRLFITNSPYPLDTQIVTTLVGSEFTTNLWYDFNDDGVIDSADARVLLRDVRNVAPITGDHEPYRDVNGDGTVDGSDVDALLGYVVDLTEIDDESTCETQTLTDGKITVPANTTYTFRATIDLTAADKDYLNNFPNGIWVEGFLYASNDDTEETTDLHMPFLGFYGGWDEAPIFDSTNPELAATWPVIMFPAKSDSYALGDNPYLVNSQRIGPEYSAISKTNWLDELDFGLLRNARLVRATATNVETGEEYYRYEMPEVPKSYFTELGVTAQVIDIYNYNNMWDCRDSNGDTLPEGANVRFRLEAWLEGYDTDGPATEHVDFLFTIDNTRPTLVLEEGKEITATHNAEDGGDYLTLTATDNRYIAAICISDMDGNIMGRYEVDNELGEEKEVTIDITGYGPDFYLIVGDYAANETRYEIHLSDEFTTANPKLAELDPNKIYACETTSSALVPYGWFSCDKGGDDFTHSVTQLTGDVANRFYSGEFINGYIIAENIDTGNLELYKPTRNTWYRTILKEDFGQQATATYGKGYIIVDMAMDYSRNRLFGIALDYGATAVEGEFRRVLGEFKFTDNDVEFVVVDELEDREGGVLTLAIDDDGTMYGVDSKAVLYRMTLEKNEESGEEELKLDRIATTNFASYPGYNGVNLIQSMCWDHENDKLYWFARSHNTDALSVAKLLEVNPENGDITELGDMHTGEETAAFVPTKQTTNLVSFETKPCTDFTMNNDDVFLLVGQATRLSESPVPTFAKLPTKVKYVSSDPSVVTVDKNGLLRSVSAGNATITVTGTVERDGKEVEVTKTVTVTVHNRNDHLYGYIAADHVNADNMYKFVTFSDSDPENVTAVTDTIMMEVATDMTGEETTKIEALLGGGVFVNDGNTVFEDETDVYGHIYSYGYPALGSGVWEDEDGVRHIGSPLMVFPVYVDKDGKVTIGEHKVVGGCDTTTLGPMSYDYKTHQMYAADYSNGGYGIVNLFDGTFTHTSDVNGIMLISMGFDNEGNLFASDISGGIFQLDVSNPYYVPNHYLWAPSEIAPLFSPIWYDYETENLYIMPDTSTAYFYAVNIGDAPETETDDPEAEESEFKEKKLSLIQLDSVSSEWGAQHTVLFTISEKTPEFKLVPSESITVSNESIQGLVGGHFQLTTTTVPELPSITTKTWTSSDEKVAKVDKTGLVTYVGPGECTITVTQKNPKGSQDVSATVSVTVKEADEQAMEAFVVSNDGTPYTRNTWTNVNDYDVRHAHRDYVANGKYALKVGAYYDGDYYGYENGGRFVRISGDAKNKITYLSEGTVGSSVTGMEFSYYDLKLYGVTGSSLVTIDLTTGATSDVGNFDKNIYNITVDKNGTLYGIGSDTSNGAGKVYILGYDGENGTNGTITCTEVATLSGSVGSGSQITYDYTTDRLYTYCSGSSTYDAVMMPASRTRDAEATSDGYDVFALGAGGVNDDSGDENRLATLKLSTLTAIPTDEELEEALEGVELSLTNIILNYSFGTIEVGETLELKAVAHPSIADESTLTWSSSDEAVATVDSNGTVTGVAAGETTITVTGDTISVTCKVKVVEKVTDSSILLGISNDFGGVFSTKPASPANISEVGDNTEFEADTTKYGAAFYDGKVYYLQEDPDNPYPKLVAYDLKTGEIEKFGNFSTDSNPVLDMGMDKSGNIYLIDGSGGVYFYNIEEYVHSVNNMWTSYQNSQKFQSYDNGVCGAFDNESGLFFYITKGLWGDYTLNTIKFGRNSSQNVVTTIGTISGIDIRTGSKMAYDAKTSTIYITNGVGSISSVKLEKTENKADTESKEPTDDSASTESTELVTYTYTIGEVTDLGQVGENIDLGGIVIIPSEEAAGYSSITTRD